jgi:hypothetical protein
MISFQIVGLSADQFSPLFELSDAKLAKLNARRVTALNKPGYPCRVSLADAEVGEELLLLSFRHQAADSPYNASGPIFVRKAALQAVIKPDFVPDYVSSRLMSVRAYDSGHLMIDAVVCAGSETSATVRRMFSSTEVAYIHLHNANRGCFSCIVNRVATNIA